MGSSIESSRNAATALLHYGLTWYQSLQGPRSRRTIDVSLSGETLVTRTSTLRRPLSVLADVELPPAGVDRVDLEVGPGEARIDYPLLRRLVMFSFVATL
jgi:hypothetical protein